MCWPKIQILIGSPPRREGAKTSLFPFYFCPLKIFTSSKTGEWTLFTGDQLGSLFASRVLHTYKASGKPVANLAMVASTVSSKMIEAMAEREGFKFVECLTGSSSESTPTNLPHFKPCSFQVSNLSEILLCNWRSKVMTFYLVTRKP
jgi:hypothetical protein